MRKGGITREPDFVIKYSTGDIKYAEFQYAKEELNAYDFKISKIASKDRTSKQRVPRNNIEILYVVKPTHRFAILNPDWIAKSSIQTVAAAWGSAPVFRVPEDRFRGVLQEDKGLKDVCEIIDKKNSNFRLSA